MTPGPYEQALRDRYALARQRMGWYDRSQPEPRAADPPVVGVRARMDDLEQALALALIRIANLEEAAMERVPKKQRLKMLLDQERGRAKKIMEEIAKKHGVSMIELTSKRRTRRIVEARFEASYVLKKSTRLSLPQIGRLLGYSDHTAILYAVRGIEKRKEQGAQ